MKGTKASPDLWLQQLSDPKSISRKNCRPRKTLTRDRSFKSLAIHHLVAHQCRQTSCSKTKCDQKVTIIKLCQSRGLMTLLSTLVSSWALIVSNITWSRVQIGSKQYTMTWKRRPRYAHPRPKNQHRSIKDNCQLSRSIQIGREALLLSRRTGWLQGRLIKTIGKRVLIENKKYRGRPISKVKVSTLSVNSSSQKRRN